MAKDGSGRELYAGDRVELYGTVVHCHAELVTVRIEALAGQFEPSMTFHPGKIFKVVAEAESDSQTKAPAKKVNAKPKRRR